MVSKWLPLATPPILGQAPSPIAMSPRPASCLLIALVLACLIVALQETAIAQPPLPDEEAFLADIPVVVSGTRLPQQTLYSPVSTTILDRETILASGFTEVAELFRLVPGFQVAQATGGHYVVTYHGQEMSLPNRMEVLINGRSVYGNLLAAVSWSALGIEPEDIERIEIIRGANSPVFGSNALVATINIMTREPYALNDTWLEATAGSLDTRKLHLHHAGMRDQLDYQIALAFKRNEGFAASDDVPDIDTTELSSITLGGQYHPGPSDELKFDLGLIAGEHATFFPLPAAVIDTHDGKLHSNYQYARWTQNLDQANERFFQFYHNFQNQHDDLLSYPLGVLLPDSVLEGLRPFFPTPETARLRSVYGSGVSERYDGEVQQISQANPRLRTAWGAGIRLDRLKSFYQLGTQKTFDNLSARAFINTEWQTAERLFINAGSMLEHNELVHLHGSARLAVNYALRRNTSLRASISHTQKSPSILEEYWNYGVYLDTGPMVEAIVKSSGDLAPERLTAYELGLVHENQSTGLHFDIKAFYEKARELVGFPVDATYPELITLNSTVGVQRVANGDRYDLNGVEGEIGWRPNRADQLRLSYSLTSSHRRAFQLPADGSVVYHTATPQQTLALLAQHRCASGISLSGAWYHMSQMEWLGDGGLQAAYDRLDLHIGIPIAQKRGRIELIGQNLTGNYIEYTPNNRVDRRYYVKMELHF